ncbi:MAG: phosphopantothenoylcysteine decarboxylase, partial [Muribaculaceae bacterium]|nr:phosphopantothenoylcysteine decarboxylase [Muribaculaceae bacterium]
MTGKKVAISVGPIPARLDSVKFITNRFKGGLAAQTAAALAEYGHEVTVVAWAYTANTALAELENHPNVKEIVRVKDVFDYYDWFAANAKDFDAFVMAAAVANLTPVKPYEGKFPSHNYRPGDEFDIKFMIAPRAIDAIKPLNPRCCLVGYKLFDTDDEDELIEIAKHTLADARANLIFANTPKTAKSRKIAVTADGSVIPCDFSEHIGLIHKAIMQNYYRTETAPLSESEQADPDIREALASVAAYEPTFPGHGTVAVPVKNRPGMFATTGRGHRSGPVLVRSVDHEGLTVNASGKATLNAPAMETALAAGQYRKIAVHRHFDDPLCDRGAAAAHAMFPDDSPLRYIFPGTDEEAGFVDAAIEPGTGVSEPYHGYIMLKDITPVDWGAYLDTFPGKYFSQPAAMLGLLENARKSGVTAIEIGGNRKPMAPFSYDPYVAPDPEYAQPVSHGELVSKQWPLAVCFNAIAYLSRAEISEILAHCDRFVANV